MPEVAASRKRQLERCAGSRAAFVPRGSPPSLYGRFARAERARQVPLDRAH